MSSVPVSQYEALRAEMRSLVQKAQQVQEIATQVISSTASQTNHQIRHDGQRSRINQAKSSGRTMESLVLEPNNRMQPSRTHEYEGTTSSADGETTTSEDECGRVPSAHLSVSSEPISTSNPGRPASSLYHGTWPVERNMWNSEPNNLDPDGLPTSAKHHLLVDQASVLSFASSSGGVPLDRVLGSPDRMSRKSIQQLEAKVDMVYSLLAMLGGQEHADMGDTLLALSTSPESCLAMRQSGCIPLLVQLVQSDKDMETRMKASQALHNLIHTQPDDKLRKRETRVLKLLEQARAYTDSLKNNTDYEPDSSTSSSTDTQLNSENDKHPVVTIANLMKHSFDEAHRQAICLLGGIHIIASLVEVEHSLHGSTTEIAPCIMLRRYACMALTNLTFGDSGNKALLCSFREFMRALVVQLQSPSDELRQVTASVLRNLSWRADSTSKDILREVGTVAGLMKAGMATSKENTLKSILSALWNLSAHCTENKLEICAVEGGLGFLIEMLSYKAPSKSLTINENAGGILRNISSQIAVRDDYREVLRHHNCLQILLEQLKSPSLTIVSNACGTLWNLSAKNQVDQETLWQMGAPAMLRSLNHSKHKMIATGSSAALKNLLNSRPSHTLMPALDATTRAMDLPVLPTLGVRKQKALLRDLDQNLSETYENIERESSSKSSKKRSSNTLKQQHVDSQEFVAHSELTYETRSTRSDSQQSDLCNGFSSLNLNEPSTSGSYQKELRNSGNARMNFSNSSLVYMNSTARTGTYLPLRNNYSDLLPDESDVGDQPIDYSQKYSESKASAAANQPFASSSSAVEQKKCSSFQYSSKASSAANKSPNTSNGSYGMYAETDLDQPTDYSLRYAEDDSDSDACDKMKGGEYDTVKMYCTEGTPLNFSTATSMTDLRADPSGAKPVINNDHSKHKQDSPASNHLDEKDHCSVEDINDLEHRQKSENIKSELSSGLMSPEKPVNYCEEGTPGCFSRVSSFGSLHSLPVNEAVVKEEVVGNSPPGEVKTNTNKINASPNEAKAVKFVEQPNRNCAEQTPLMFSRSSSLASLDSVEQHSIHDDRSSVVSDFSRLTSGIVSPSELPDSPTQTVPPSPRPRKTVIEFPSTSRVPAARFGERPLPAPRTLQKPSFFEDNITKFKEESTPIQFSTATSISSLTIDDHDEPIRGDLKQHRGDTEVNNGGTSQSKEEESEKQDIEPEKPDSSSEFNEQLSDHDEDDDILADCIKSGMQNKRHTQSKEGSPPTSKIPSYKALPIPRSGGSGIPLSRKSVALVRPVSMKPPTALLQPDVTRTYYTEDTPAALSHAGSNSDLSVLSTQTSDNSKLKRDYLSDDSSNLSGDNDNILAECIQSGMPKAKTSSVREKRQIPCLQTSTPNKPFARNVTSGFCVIDDKKKYLPPYVAQNDEVSSFAVENSPCQFSLRSSLSDLTVDGSVAGLTRTLGEGENSSNGKKQQTASSRKSSIPGPSSSVHNTTNESMVRQESLSSLSVESLASLDAEQALLEQCISSGMPKSKYQLQQSGEKPVGVATKHLHVQKENVAAPNPKNGNAASAAGNNTSTAPRPNNVPATAADGGAEENYAETSTISPRKRATGTTVAETYPVILQGKLSPTEESYLTDPTRNGCDMSYLKIDDPCVDLEPKCALVDNRMLDPDAMIESLDRFTAELVSQSHLQNKEENKIATSITEAGDTWDDDISPNDVTFPSISSAPNIITFESDHVDGPEVEIEEQPQQQPPAISSDFSSLDTSTMTESTLIAMEATKMATTFQQQANMCHSIGSVQSLELDQVQPPSHMNSLTNSALDCVRSSPKLVRRKRSLPAGLMVKRALSNSLNQGSSLESLDNHSVSNLDQVNPPSAMADILDMDGSMTSVASLPSETSDFQLNCKVSERIAHQQQQHPIFNVKQPANMLHLLASSSHAHSISDLENMNPPSLFNEITDMCNSLADVPTETSEMLVFEDCSTLKTENDITEFSDATSITPIQSDVSSAETTPKKVKSLNRQMTPKQRRNLAKERYKTYTVAADMIMREEEQKLTSPTEDASSLTEDFKTVACDSEGSYRTVHENFSTATFTKSPKKTTPKERRQNDRDRFQTQVLDKSDLSSPEPSPSPPPSSSKIRTDVRKTFLQRRFENKDRFKTQTIPAAAAPDQSAAVDNLHDLLQEEANLVLKTLRETKAKPEELLECETLSLVSNDDDSEHNSVGSVNYRTYHKSWGVGGCNVPVIQPVDGSSRVSSDVENYLPDGEGSDHALSDDDDKQAKPKIVKPSGVEEQQEDATKNEDDGQGKGIRGRRKPLYSKANVNNKLPQRNFKPLKAVTSNLVRNVTSSLKSSTNQLKQSKIAAKPPIPQSKVPRVPQPTSTGNPKTTSNGSSPRGSPVRSAAKTSPKRIPEPIKNNANNSKGGKPLERQGTFTKEETKPAKTSKIPSAIPKAASTSRIAKAINPSAGRTSNGKLIKSASSDRANKPAAASSYIRSPSADSRVVKNGTAKKSPEVASNSNAKQITSRIANLWKKVEENKKQPLKKDTRVWIQNKEVEEEEAPMLIRSKTFESKDQTEDNGSLTYDSADMSF